MVGNIPFPKNKISKKSMINKYDRSNKCEETNCKILIQVFSKTIYDYLIKPKYGKQYLTH
jgi:hypothetical protein